MSQGKCEKTMSIKYQINYYFLRLKVSENRNANEENSRERRKWITVARNDSLT